VAASAHNAASSSLAVIGFALFLGELPERMIGAGK
jgi:hypothetical protein